MQGYFLLAEEPSVTLQAACFECNLNSLMVGESPYHPVIDRRNFAHENVAPMHL
jgi:hypothetical protein